MSLPPLPPVSYWRSPRPSNAGVLYDTRRDAVANGEQVCEDLYTADQMRAIRADGVRVGMEQARTMCNDYSKHLIATGAASTPSEWEAHGAESCANLIGGLSEYGDPPESEHFAGTYAAAIRAAAKQGGHG
jgi:hypothetical protein